MLQCITMCGSDNRMDHKGVRDPLNVLPLKCPSCAMCDLEFVPQPYFIGRGLNSQTGMQVAEVGNLLVRVRVKQILEAVAPGQCRFYPTTSRKSMEQTDWFLAVPQNQVVTGAVKSSVPRCPDCGEPQHAHGTQYDENWERRCSPVTPFDICKSQNWFSSGDRMVRSLPKGIDKRGALELSKFIYFSLRLELLLKKAGVRGLNRWIASSGHPGPQDHQWVREQLAAIEGLGGQASNNRTEEWFENYLRRLSKKEKIVDFTSTEKSCGVQLPQSYKDFVQRIGKKKYRNIDGEAGFNVTVLLPNALSCDESKAAIKENPSDELAYDGIIFAEAEHGDFFCFKVAPVANSEYEVYRYDHEIMDFEPYAKNFAGCIQSWDQR